MTAAVAWDAIVVGAGIAGLAAARELSGSGLRVLVLDKSRGLGGRMATRRLGTAVFDHGAQFFTVRREQFGELVTAAQAADVVAAWCTGFSRPLGHGCQTQATEDGHPRWRGVRGMTDLPKWLAASLPPSCEIRSAAKVAAVRMSADRVIVDLDGGAAGMTSLSARAVILTPPVPQSLDLLAAGGLMPTGEADAEAGPLDAAAIRLLRTIDYDPCFAMLLVLERASCVPPPGAVQFAADDPVPIAWLADNQKKGISPVPAVTVHASGRFSREHFDAPQDEVAAMLLEHVRPWIDGDPAAAVRERSIHRWKFALPTSLVPEPLVAVSTTPAIVCCGDAFAGPRVEGAASSGLAAGRWVAGKLVDGPLAGG